MITIGSRVRHIDTQIDMQKGIMSVLDITNGFATCWYPDFDRSHFSPETYKLTELKLA